MAGVLSGEHWPSTCKAWGSPSSTPKKIQQDTGQHWFPLFKLCLEPQTQPWGWDMQPSLANQSLALPWLPNWLRRGEEAGEEPISVGSEQPEDEVTSGSSQA
jgi:hypothetical protein